MTGIMLLTTNRVNAQTITPRNGTMAYASYTQGVGGSGAGSTLTPAVGVYYYDEGTVVPLSAAANVGFNFTGWTGPVANAGAPSTTVTMTGP